MDFKWAFINMFKEKETIKKSGTIIFHQIGNSNTERNQFEKESNRNSVVKKKTIIEIKNSLEGLNIRFEQAEERTSKCEDSLIEIIWGTERKRMKKINRA